jgi:hypothetical protein
MASLRSAITDKEILTAVEHVWEVAQKNIHEFQKGKTGQGYNHCLRVEENIWKLIDEDGSKFSQLELFLLSASAALHDIGRIGEENAGEGGDHGELAKKLLFKDNNWKNFFPEERARAEAVGYIVSVHCSGKIDDIPDEFAVGGPQVVLLRSLASIFRLADMLDTDYRRTPYLIKSFKELQFPEDVVKIWTARSCIHGWRKTNDGKLLLQAYPDNEEERIIALAYVDLLNEDSKEAQRKHLENCMVWNVARTKKETIQLPCKFFLEEFEQGRPIISEGLVRFYTDFADRYLSRVGEIYSDIDLRGIGDISGLGPTKLSNVFVNVKVALDPHWRTEDYKNFREKTVAMIEKCLSGGNAMPITEAIDIPELKRIVLLGEPGSGKTTISRFLCLNYKAIEQNVQDTGHVHMLRGIPLLVTIREFISEKGQTPELTIPQFLSKRISSIVWRPVPLGFVEFWLSKEGSLTILDGLDEVIRPDERKIMRDIADTIIRRFPEGNFLLTSRIVGYEEAPFSPEVFLHLRLQKLEDSQIQTFIERWYEERESDPNARKLLVDSLQEAVKDEHVKELAQNALLLSMMAIVHGAEADLPKQRARLYARCAEAFLVSRNKMKDLLSYNPEEIKKCHEFLGYWMHTRAENAPAGTSEVPVQELKQALVKEILTWHEESSEHMEKKVDKFIDASRERVGLIVERSPGIFAFGHRSFEEYFAAKYISQNTCGTQEIWATISGKVGRPHWLEVLKLLAGIYGDINRKQLNVLVDRILEEDLATRSLNRKEIILAGEIAGDKVPLNDVALKEIADRVTSIFLDTQDTDLFGKCHDVLEHLFGTAVEKYMMGKLRQVRPAFVTGRPFQDFHWAARQNKVDTKIARLIALL